jgi:hypothetical protein
VMAAAVALLGEHLGVDRVSYSEIVDDKIVRGCVARISETNAVCPVLSWFR